MDKLDDEAAYLLHRAKEEDRQATAATHPKASEVHRALSRRYAAQAFIAQLGASEDGASNT